MEYNIIVNLASQTVAELNTDKYSLVYFTSSSSNLASSAFPLCYGLVNRFLTSLKITVKDKLFAYVSDSPLGDKKNIYIEQLQLLESLATKRLQKRGARISTSHLIKLGKTFTLNSDLTVEITENSTQDILIINKTNDEFTAGIGVYDNEDSPYYRGINAQTLYNTVPLQLTPGSKILLAILPNNSIQINMAVDSPNVNFIVIDMSNNPTEVPTVTYSLKRGWESNDSRVTKYNSSSNLRSILISFP